MGTFVHFEPVQCGTQSSQFLSCEVLVFDYPSNEPEHAGAVTSI